jgi:CBS domain-containing protein
MILEEVTNFLKKEPPFQFLDESALKSVANSLSMEFYPKDTVILKQDGPPSDSLRIIKKGAVKVFIKSKSGGEEVVMDYKGEGDNFGFSSMISKGIQRTTVVAVDDTICYLLRKERILKLLESSPAFSEYFMSYLSRYLDRTYREMQSKSTFYGSSGRVLFTTPVEDIAKEVVSVGEETSIQEAAQVMARKKISSLIILDKRKLPVGIVTDKDLSDKVVAKARSVSEPVKNIMTISLIRVDASDSCFEAVLKMIKYNIHHMLVIKGGALKGIMTDHDLTLPQGTSPLSSANDVENQQTIDGLISVSEKMNTIVGLLLEEGTKASCITKIITEINDRLVKKVLEIAEKTHGQAPVPYCWIASGSEGRKEQTFKTDQDNAIIYADPETAEEEEIRRYFSIFTSFVRDSLIKVGFPLCPADCMASNPRWCQPLKAWKRYCSDWINEPTADAVLKSLIFFDSRPIYGKFGIFEELRDSVYSLLEGRSIFLGHMANMIIKNTPPIGFLKSFVVEKTGEHKDKFNLKVKGITPLVDAVRLCALERRIKETSTMERIHALKDKHTVVKEFSDELEHALEFMMHTRIHHQFVQIKEGMKADNFINPNTLSNFEKKTVSEVFHLISKMQGLIFERYKLFMT